MLVQKETWRHDQYEYASEVPTWSVDWIDEMGLGLHGSGVSH